jgi:hypothetical protein
LQPLDVAIFLSFSINYIKQLDDFIKKSYSFTWLKKRDFFWFFWASWDMTFTSKNINLVFRTTGLYPFNPELIINKFIKKISSRPSSSESGGLIILAKDWRQLNRLIRAAVIDIFDEKAI